MRVEGLAKALWLLFFFVFCWPFIGVMDEAGLLFGVPAFLFRTFLAWGALVAALAAVSRRMED